jgi:hypothetical protein
MNIAKKLSISAWSMSGFVSLLAFLAWGGSYGWRFDQLTTYQIFPLFGLLAFSIMWSHYAAGTLRQYLNVDKAVLKPYFAVTSYIVLVAILLHPGILIFQLFRDGMGLPPASYASYVAPGLVPIVLLGTACWFVFMGYELHRFFGDRSWWRFVQYASDVAMIGIFYHALRLGNALQGGWYVFVWYFYGITLVAMLGYGYVTRHKNK